MFKHHLLLTCLVITVGCGRAAPPIPPEALAPGGVGEFSVTAQGSKVTLSWTSPENDVRGKPLKSMTGYNVYRQVVGEAKESLLTSVTDRYLPELLAAKQKAFEEDRPMRGIKIDEKLRQHSFVDTTVQSGQKYRYRVAPINQAKIEGNSKVAVVEFDPKTSRVSYPEAATTTESDT